MQPRLQYLPESVQHSRVELASSSLPRISGLSPILAKQSNRECYRWRQFPIQGSGGYPGSSQIPNLTTALETNRRGKSNRTSSFSPPANSRSAVYSHPTHPQNRLP